MFTKLDLSIQSTAGITQVNSVSGFYFCFRVRAGDTALRESLIYSLQFSYLIYSLSFFFLYSLHQRTSPECANLHLFWPPGSYVWKGPTGGASERAAEKGR